MVNRLHNRISAADARRSNKKLHESIKLSMGWRYFFSQFAERPADATKPKASE
jgi:hypothetical protein